MKALITNCTRNSGLTIMRALARLIKEHAADDAGFIAEVYAFHGQSDEAMHWLERAYVQKDSVVAGIKGDTLLKNLPGDPRY